VRWTHDSVRSITEGTLCTLPAFAKARMDSELGKNRKIGNSMIVSLNRLSKRLKAAADGGKPFTLFLQLAAAAPAAGVGGAVGSRAAHAAVAGLGVTKADMAQEGDAGLFGEGGAYRDAYLKLTKVNPRMVRRCTRTGHDVADAPDCIYAS
jgi:hypothetical protein